MEAIMTKIKSILFATDYSRCASQALRHALSLAERYDAVLELVHVIRLSDEIPVAMYDYYAPYMMSAGSADQLDVVFEGLKSSSEAHMEKWLEEHSVKKDSIKHSHIDGASIAPAIVEHAKEHEFDLIIIGTHGYRGIKHLFLGSVAEEVVRSAHCPVYTYREHEEDEPCNKIGKILVPVDFSEFSKSTLKRSKQLAADFDASLEVLYVMETIAQPTFYGTENYVTQIMSRKTVHGYDDTLSELKAFYKNAGGPSTAVNFHILEGDPASSILRFAKDGAVDLIFIATHGLTGLEHFLLGSVTERVVRQSPCAVFTLKPFEGKTEAGRKEGEDKS